MRTDDELKKIAADYKAGKIFTDRQVKEAAHIPRVFLPVGITPKEEWRAKIEKEGLYLVFEYIDKALALRFNEMPVFRTMQFLTRDEAAKVEAFFKEMP